MQQARRLLMKFHLDVLRQLLRVVFNCDTFPFFWLRECDAASSSVFPWPLHEVMFFMQRVYDDPDDSRYVCGARSVEWSTVCSTRQVNATGKLTPPKSLWSSV